MHGVARLGSQDFGRIDRKQRIAGGGATHHIQTLGGGDLGYAAMRRLASRNPAHAAKAQVGYRLLGQAEVAEMNRIESAAEQA